VLGCSLPWDGSVSSMPLGARTYHPTGLPRQQAADALPDAAPVAQLFPTPPHQVRAASATTKVSTTRARCCAVVMPHGLYAARTRCLVYTYIPLHLTGGHDSALTPPTRPFCTVAAVFFGRRFHAMPPYPLFHYLTFTAPDAHLRTSAATHAPPPHAPRISPTIFPSAVAETFCLRCARVTRAGAGAA